MLTPSPLPKTSDDADDANTGVGNSHIVSNAGDAGVVSLGGGANDSDSDQPDHSGGQRSAHA
jgi:hypothetical protein